MGKTGRYLADNQAVLPDGDTLDDTRTHIEVHQVDQPWMQGKEMSPQVQYLLVLAKVEERAFMTNQGSAHWIRPSRLPP